MDSQILHNIAGFILILSAILLTAGLIRPFIVVWWTNNKTRGKVLAVYGSLVLIFSIIFFVTIDPQEDGRKDLTTPKEQTQQDTRDGGDANN
jgi:drug/metabolite transporter superfamily protein YnfA